MPTELEMQKSLADSLNAEFQKFKLKTTAFYGNQFKNSNGKHWGRKPDLVVFGGEPIFHPRTKETGLLNPIGIEFKDSGKFNDITKGVIDQIKGTYSTETYCFNDNKTPFKLASLAFTTTSGCKEGIIYKKNFPEAANFFIERFCWRCKVAVLLKYKDGLVWSYRNYLFNLNGKIRGRYSESGKIETYNWWEP